MVKGTLPGRGIRIEHPAQATLFHRHPHPGRHPGPQRSRGDLDPGNHTVFRVTGTDSPGLAEVTQVIEGHIETGQEKLNVLQRRGMSRGQHKAVPPQPLRVLGVQTHDVLVEQIGGTRQRNRGARVSVSGIFYHVPGQGFCVFDCLGIQLCRGESHGFLCPSIGRETLGAPVSARCISPASIL